MIRPLVKPCSSRPGETHEPPSECHLLSSNYSKHLPGACDVSGSVSISLGVERHLTKPSLTLIETVSHFHNLAAENKHGLGCRPLGQGFISVLQLTIAR